MGAQSRLFTSLVSGSGKATAVVACAVMLLAGCGGSGGNATGGGDTGKTEPVIRGAGGPGLNVTAVAGTNFGDVVVSWSGDASGYPGFIGYVVQKRRNGGTYGEISAGGCSFGMTASSTSQQCTATGLPAGTYTFQVALSLDTEPGYGTFTGSNDVTISEASTATAPDAPSISGVNVSRTYVVVVFKAPASNGGSLILDYTATAKPTIGPSVTKTVTQFDSGSVTVTGLTAGTLYSFTVTARNSVNSSAPSAERVVTTRG